MQNYRTPYRAMLPTFIVLALVAGLLFHATPTDGDFWWYDASRHAMNGVFVRDFIVQAGWLHPLEFAKNYYNQYPAVNIGIYPPLLYLTSVPFLIVFGVSHAISQLVVILYGLAAGLFTYLICARRMDSLSATATAIVAMTVPGVALWSRQVQPDVPATAFILATIYFLFLYFEEGAKRPLYFSAVCMGCAVLTRTQMVFAIPLFAFFVVFHPIRCHVSLRTRLTALTIAAVIAFPAVAMLLYFMTVFSKIAVAAPDALPLWSIENWTWYATKIYDHVGIPGAILIVVGLVAGASFFGTRGNPYELAAIAGFAMSCWLFFTLVSSKEQRYVLVFVVLMLILAAQGLHLAWASAAKCFLPVIACLSGYFTIFRSEIPIFGGYQEAVEAAVAHTPKNSNILVSAQRDGSFIYNLRALGTRPDIGVRRGDKLFVEMRISRLLGIRDRGLDQDAILRILNEEKISTVVAQNNYLDDQPSIKNFQKLLESERLFAVISRIPLRGDVSRFERELVVYGRLPVAQTP